MFLNLQNLSHKVLSDTDEFKIDNTENVFTFHVLRKNNCESFLDCGYG